MITETITLGEYIFFGAVSFVLVVSAILLVLFWWRTFVNPQFPSRGLPSRVDEQEARIAHLEKRVAQQDEELEVLRQRVTELSDRLSNASRGETW